MKIETGPLMSYFFVSTVYCFYLRLPLQHTTHATFPVIHLQIGVETHIRRFIDGGT